MTSYLIIVPISYFVGSLFYLLALGLGGVAAFALGVTVQQVTPDSKKVCPHVQRCALGAFCGGKVVSSSILFRKKRRPPAVSYSPTPSVTLQRPSLTLQPPSVALQPPSVTLQPL